MDCGEGKMSLIGAYHFPELFEQTSSVVKRIPLLIRNIQILGFSATFNYLSEPVRKQLQVHLSGFKMRDFDLFCVFQVSRVLNFRVRVFASFSSQVFLPSFRNMASLDSQGEIVPIELPNPA